MSVLTFVRSNDELYANAAAAAAVARSGHKELWRLLRGISASPRFLPRTYQLLGGGGRGVGLLRACDEELVLRPHVVLMFLLVNCNYHSYSKTSS